MLIICALMFIVIVIDSQDIVWEKCHLFFLFLFLQENNNKKHPKAKVETKAFKRKEKKKHLIYHAPW